MKRVWFVAVLCLVVFVSDVMGQANLTLGGNVQPDIQEVAPGIWRLRWGTPEKFTAVSICPQPVRIGALAELPPAPVLPLNVSDIYFQQSARGCVVDLPMTDAEQVYGFGAHLVDFNATGTRKSVLVNDNPESEDGSGHGPVPFYVSTQGYGILVDTLRYARFYCGNLAKVDGGARQSGGPSEVATTVGELYAARSLIGKRMTVDIPVAQGIDVYLFAGPTTREAIQRYNLFGGGGAVPPWWGLGIYYRGFGQFKAEDVLALAREFRQQQIPISVFGLEPGWHSHAYSCSYRWSERFPDPNGFIAEMKSLGYQINLWEQAFVYPTAPFYAAIKPYCGDYLVWEGLVPDFTLPQARQVFNQYHEKAFLQQGITSFKLDEVDNQPHRAHPWSFPETSRFPSGLDGEQMHSALGLVFQRSLNQMFVANNLRTWSQVRASHGLAASSPFVLYSDAYDHRGYVRGILNAGFSGLLWQPELRVADSIPELYRRAQTAICSPQALVNAWFMPMPPWQQIKENENKAHQKMADWENAEKVIKDIFNLRMSLIPYLYSAFMDYHQTGLPPFRALVVDYPADVNTHNLDDEYMMGPSLLVAPIFGNETRRKVYLPAGDWYCFWSHKFFTGGQTYDIDMPIERIPLFVKANTLLPLAKSVEYLTSATVFEITVGVYGSGPAQAMLYEDDGTSYAFQQGQQNRLQLQWDAQTGGKTTRTGHYPDLRYQITGWHLMAGTCARKGCPEGQ